MHIKKIITIITAVVCVTAVCVVYAISSHKEPQAVSYSEPLMSNSYETESESLEIICVYVCGCVINPGVVYVEQGARICDAISLCGGLTDDAALDMINQAEIMTDGQKIYGPAIGENVVPEGNTSGLVNINTADKSSLMTLPGIGESRAEAIIQYRETEGAFQTIEEIMNVSGIKESAYNKIKDYICVK